MQRARGIAAWFAVALGAFGAVTATALASDWASWRGPEQNGVSRDTGLPSSWSTDPKEKDNNLLWTAHYGCRSTPIVMNGRVYVNNGVDPDTVTEQERVVCLDADTGKLIWERRFNVWHTDIVSVRLGWTTLCGDPATGNIYMHGTQGLLACLDGKTGKTLWERSLTEEFGRVSGYGGRLTSPVVDEDLVIMGLIQSSWGDLGAGSPRGNRFVAFDKLTGKLVWWSEPGELSLETYYSNPVIAVINGQRLAISGAADGGVYALQPRTGKKVWGVKIATAAINSTPVVDGTRVYACHAETTPGTNILGGVVCLDAGAVTDGKPKILWQELGIKVKYTTPVVHDGKVYVADDVAKLFCFDGATGKVLWRQAYGRNAKGSPVWADGKIYVAAVNSTFHILEPGPRRAKELHRQFFPAAAGAEDVELNGTPAVANGRIYFGTSDALYCIGKQGEKSKTEAAPPLPTEAKEGAPAQVLLVPAEVSVKPGESVSFEVRVFDANGRRLKASTPAGKWSLPAFTAKGGPTLQGKLDGATFTASKDVPAQAGYVEFQSEHGAARARVRVVPNLPYTEDFEKVPVGGTPAGWVNAQGKFLVKKLSDGSQVLAKFNTVPSPLLSRGNAYLGAHDLSDYTIEADAQGVAVRKDLPDMGVVASRYSLILGGNTQKLRLLSWEAMPRLDATIPFEWKAGVWYRMKLTTETKGDKGVIRGKVWPRGEKEPDAWTVEVTDPKPNREGAPALYAYVIDNVVSPPGTDVYFDNVRVTPNKK